MNAEELSFGLSTVLSLIFGSGGAIGVWFALKGQVDLLKKEVQTLKEDKKIAHDRITKLSNKVDVVEKYGPEIKLELKEMEIRLIHAIRDEISKNHKKDDE